MNACNNLRRVIAGMCIAIPLCTQTVEALTCSDLGFEFKGIEIRRVEVDGGFVVSYRLTPDDVDTYLSQKILGLIVVTDKGGEVLKIKPILRKSELPSLEEILGNIGQGKTLQEISEKVLFLELTELERVGFLRRIAMAILILEDDKDVVSGLRGPIGDAWLEILKKHGVMMFGEKGVDSRNWARLILRRVEIR